MSNDVISTVDMTEPGVDHRWSFVDLSVEQIPVFGTGFHSVHALGSMQEKMEIVGAEIQVVGTGYVIVREMCRAGDVNLLVTDWIVLSTSVLRREILRYFRSCSRTVPYALEAEASLQVVGDVRATLAFLVRRSVE